MIAPGVSFLEAPDPAAETAAVLRRVKALLLGEAGVGTACLPDDILIATRDWGRYGPHLRSFGRRYGLPLALHQGAPLGENPAVAALLRALALPEADFRRQSVLDALETPYLCVPGLPDDGLRMLDQAARAWFVISGRDEWRSALSALAEGRKPPQDEDEAETDAPAAPTETVHAVSAALERLFDALELAPVARVADYTAQIDRLIGPDERETQPGEDSDEPEVPAYTLGLLAAVRADADAERMARDLKALNALKGVLRGLRASSVMLAGMGVVASDQMTRAEFLADLRREIASVTLDDAQGRDGRVLATTVSDARGMPHKHVFILGLSESIFPAPVPEDPLLLESERQALRDRGLPVPLRAERSDDAGLFYELAGLAGKTLVLSRPALRDGAEWIDSALWRSAAAAFDEPPMTKLKVGAVTPPTETATIDEAALAVAICTGSDLPPLEGALAGWLARANPAAWARLGGAYAVEAGRLSRRSPYDSHSGRLADGGLVAHLAQRFGPDYAWSASQLNQLGECGFRFFSNRLLDLKPLEPPQAGLDVLQRGTLYHHLLERTYVRIRDEGLTLIAANAERALVLLDEEADRAFAQAPAELGFRPRPGWVQEQRLIRQRAADLVRADFEGGVVSKQQQDAPGDGAGERRVMFLEATYDAANLLTLDDGRPVRVRGIIDRIDQQGDRWLVVDYKSGTKAIGAAETTRGRNFQMMIYLLALRAQQPEGAAGGFFWHITNQAASGALWLDTAAGAEVIGTRHREDRGANHRGAGRRFLGRAERHGGRPLQPLLRLSGAVPHGSHASAQATRGGRAVSTTKTFTKAQIAAFTTLDRNLLVNAGAGSGKTAVLVERFVTLLANPAQSGIESVSQIVAITFTIKAAQEMRARVRDRLNECLAVAENAEERLRWARHLAAFDGARISTIHALAAALLRANAAEVEGGLDPAFEVLDEVQSRSLADDAVEDALRATAHDDPALAVFAETSADIVLDQLRSAIPWAVPELPGDLLGHWAQAQAALWERMRPGLIAGLSEQLNWSPPPELPPEDKRWLVWQDACAARDELADAPGNWPDCLARLSAINLHGGSRKAWGEDELAESSARLKAVRELVGLAQAWLGSPVSDDPHSPDARAAELVRCWHTLIGRAQARYAELKLARGAVDFDDLERMALALLRKPTVRARYDGAEFRHVMVDEFQDTSETQWQIIQRLANPARPGALFLVGDPKQSIYGFRGADARVFERARREIEEAGGATFALARSFRTHSQLVAQFNGLFEALLVRDAAHPASAYQTAFSADDLMDAHRETSAGQPPALEFLFADKANATDDDDTGRAREAAAIAERIQALADAGRDYSDITLLFRATASMPVYEEALKEAGIPYVTVGGRGYYDRQEVWDVLALLRALYRPDDALSLATALRSPMFALSDDALLALRLKDGAGQISQLWEALARASDGELPHFPQTEREAAVFAYSVLTSLRDDAGRVPLSDLIEAALSSTGYRAVLSALPDGARRRGNIDKLVSKAAEAGTLSLGAFLELLGDLTERETREGEAVVDVTGAVRLMTIHAAKGLEFPVVFVADAGRSPRGGAPELMLDEALGLTARLHSAGEGAEQNNKKTPQSFAFGCAGELDKARGDAEARRLLYVAATRAKDLVIVSAAVKQNKDDSLGAQKGLLGLLVPVVDFDEHLFLAGADEAEVELFGGPATMRCRRQPRPHGWSQPPGRWPVALPAPAVAPALLRALDADPWAVARSLSATSVAELGKSRIAQTDDERALARRRWRSRVLRAGPEHLAPVAPPSGGSFRFRRLLGEVVHKALRWCPAGVDDDRLRALIESTLWEAGMLPEAGGEALAGQALELMRTVLKSDMQREIEAAQRVYRELPFAYQTGKRAIYGIIDVLFQRPDGNWVLVDYKTASVKGSNADDVLAKHASQYHFQLAVYAAAVRDLLAPPDLHVYIHYIQHDHTLLLAPSDLADALQLLEGTIGQMCAEDAPA